MSSSKNPKFLVEMPSQGIIFRNVNNNDTLYAYYAVETFRNEKGQPTCKRVCIGKKDNESGKLIPNDKYYEIFNETPITIIPSIENPFVNDYGHYCLVDKVTRDLNLKPIVQSTFENKWKEILSLAFYMLSEGNTINGCDVWFEKNCSFLDKVINSQRASEVFASISLQERINFFKLWRSVCHDKEFVAYDVTSLSSYTRNMNIFEYGYNRDGDNLPQINMALFYGESSQLPIFYNVYNGSITDKSDLINVMRYTDLLEMNTTRYVMDRGFYSKNNIAYFNANNKKFIMAVENRLSFINNIIKDVRSTITNLENRIDSFDLYGCKRKYENPKNKKQNLDVYIYFSYERKELESKQLEQKLKRLEKELTELEDFGDKNLESYKKYFKIKIEKNTLIFERDYEKINEENSYNGFFSFISNDETVTTYLLLVIYKKRGYAEQSFDNIKNSIDMKRLKTHNINTTEGKIFVAFISLIYKSYIGRKLKEHNDNYNMNEDKKSLINLASYSPQLLLKELSKIQITNIFGKTSLFKTLSKKQKYILNIFSLTEEKINKDLK